MGMAFRFIMNNLGDIVVGKVFELWVRLTAYKPRPASSGGRSRLVLNQKRERIHRNIGIRLGEIKTASPELEIFHDSILTDLFRDLADLEAAYAALGEKEAPAESGEPKFA